MTSPTLPPEQIPPAVALPARAPGSAPRGWSTLRAPGCASSVSNRLIPLLLFFVTLASTSSVGMRYMENFRQGRAPLTDDTDILPYNWVLAHLAHLSSGLPFALTLIGILLAHEFGHYFACRAFRVRASLPYMLPAPSVSGTFGAVIRLRSRVQTPAALIVIGAAGPIAGFAVAVIAVVAGLSLSTYSAQPVLKVVQAPLLIAGVHAVLSALRVGPALPLTHIVPHPVLTASWIGLLITALNLIPAGQLDGGHILYAISPRAHAWTSRIVVVLLFALGLFSWSGWLLWSLILMTPPMRHPHVPSRAPLTFWQKALFPICCALFVLTATYEPLRGYGLINVLREL